MGCNCSGSKKPSIWQYTATDGRVTNFPTQIQANAFKIRQGGGTVAEVRR